MQVFTQQAFIAAPPLLHPYYLKSDVSGTKWSLPAVVPLVEATRSGFEGVRFGSIVTLRLL